VIYLEKEYVRLDKIYTRGGDKGKTSLFGGSRVSKNSRKVEAYGSIDEAGSVIGEARAVIKDEEVKGTLIEVQKKLLVVGAWLASDTNGAKILMEKVTEKDVEKIELSIDKFSKELLPLKEFVIPGDFPGEAKLHTARTVVRRCERRAVELSEEEYVPTELISYINRVSDLLFVMARAVKERELIKIMAVKIIEAVEKINKNNNQLTLELSKKIIEAGEVKARELGKDFVMALVDSSGHLIAHVKMDDAIFASIDIALKKAYTSTALKMTTEDIAALVKPDKSLYGLQNDPRYIVFGGGIPLVVEKEIVGAVGVSGGSVEEDIVIANACVEKLNQLLKTGI